MWILTWTLVRDCGRHSVVEPLLVIFPPSCLQISMLFVGSSDFSEHNLELGTIVGLKRKRDVEKLIWYSCLEYYLIHWLDNKTDFSNPDKGTWSSRLAEANGMQGFSCILWCWGPLGHRLWDFSDLSLVVFGAHHPHENIWRYCVSRLVFAICWQYSTVSPPFPFSQRQSMCLTDVWK